MKSAIILICMAVSINLAHSWFFPSCPTDRSNMMMVAYPNNKEWKRIVANDCRDCMGKGSYSCCKRMDCPAPAPADKSTASSSSTPSTKKSPDKN